ncbi:hypothetical protein SpCBS45565_g01006 [Spizellomyces sp. 'palustris']|nr:hypothetical protein SpCBS45565_g01006 [Spizellomyces sp. 'palustris']
MYDKEFGWDTWARRSSVPNDTMKTVLQGQRSRSSSFDTGFALIKSPSTTASFTYRLPEWGCQVTSQSENLAKVTAFSGLDMQESKLFTGIQSSVSESSLDRLALNPPPFESAKTPQWSDAASRFMEQVPLLTPSVIPLPKKNDSPTKAKPDAARYFVIKSSSPYNVQASLRYNIWSSTDLGNRRLDTAFRASPRTRPLVYLFFSVASSGRFCGVARMTSSVDWNASTDVWEHPQKWKGVFNLEWLLVKDVPNQVFRHLRVPANENKPVPNSRDTQELTSTVGQEVLKLFAIYPSDRCVLDDAVEPPGTQKTLPSMGLLRGV